MGTHIAIVLAGFLVAVAIMLTGRYQITPIQFQGMTPITWRVDRWTGTIEGCALDADTMKNPNSFVGARMVCAAP